MGIVAACIGCEAWGTSGEEVNIDADRVGPPSDGRLGACGNAVELNDDGGTGVAPSPRLVLGIGVGREGPVEKDCAFGLEGSDWTCCGSEGAAIGGLNIGAGYELC